MSDNFSIDDILAEFSDYSKKISASAEQKSAGEQESDSRRDHFIDTTPVDPKETGIVINPAAGASDTAVRGNPNVTAEKTILFVPQKQRALEEGEEDPEDEPEEDFEDDPEDDPEESEEFEDEGEEESEDEDEEENEGEGENSGADEGDSFQSIFTIFNGQRDPDESPRTITYTSLETFNMFDRPSGFVRFLLGLVFLIVSLAVMAWAGLNLSLDHGVATLGGTASANTSVNLTPKLDVFVNNSTADALGDLTFIRKIYTIADDALAPAPDPAAFGKLDISEAGQVLDIIERARRSGLLDGQEVIFSDDVEFYPYSDIEYYYDDTILVIAWKELINNRICSCVEVKVADPSQFRRKLADDYFGSPTWAFASELSNSVNAVVAMNADFYAFRNLGVSAFQGTINRYETTCDVLYIDKNGDFITQKRGSFEGREATQQFIWDNNIQFSLAFGPVIVENGEAIHVVDGYSGLGEMNLEYSRAAVAQFDKLHYLYMTVNHASPGEPTHPRANVVQFADIVASKGVQTAYNLDGGQTSEIFFQGDMYNRVDWGNERPVSDIIYFATALPEDQR